MKRSMMTVVSIFGLGAVAACTLEAPPAEGTAEPEVQAGDAGDGEGAKVPKGASAEAGAQADSCPYTGPPIDVSGFASCRDGGRCVPESVVPDDQRARLAKCAANGGGNGFCVPEKIIAAKGLLLPATCTSIAGGEGRCVSTVFPDMDAQKATLPVDVCDPSERCAPCYDPVTGAASGACSSVSCDAPKKPKVVFGECCMASGKPRGRCVPTSILPDEALDGLETRECESDERCAPSETLAPGYVPPKCKASSLLGTYDGVCISDCVKKDFLTQMATSQGSCSAGSFCAPCKNPLTGQSTGAPGCT